MTEKIDMRIEPKSNQLNADDLITGPITVTITGVRGLNSDEQPVEMTLSDGRKPYYPCKSMRRMLIAVWGPDAKAYVGRRLTLYRDPAVAFGGLTVGGIRISHASHIDAPVLMALTVTRGKKAPYRVLPLASEDTDQRGRLADAAALARTLDAEWSAYQESGELPDDYAARLAELCSDVGRASPLRAAVRDDQSRALWDGARHAAGRLRAAFDADRAAGGGEP